MALMTIHGACHCGAIQFTAQADPQQVMACHCTDCQQISGGPFRAVLPVAAEQFDCRGTPQRYVKVAASGNRRVQAFCGTCGSAVYACAEESPTVYNLRLGCVAERAQLPPVRQIWHDSAMPWLTQLAQVPALRQGAGSAAVLAEELRPR